MSRLRRSWSGLPHEGLNGKAGCRAGMGLPRPPLIWATAAAPQPAGRLPSLDRSPLSQLYHYRSTCATPHTPGSTPLPRSLPLPLPQPCASSPLLLAAAAQCRRRPAGKPATRWPMLLHAQSAGPVQRAGAVPGVWAPCYRFLATSAPCPNMSCCMHHPGRRIHC